MVPYIRGAPYRTTIWRRALLLFMCFFVLINGDTRKFAPFSGRDSVEISPIRIPHIIHQTWSSEDVPAKNKPWIESCRRLHRDWEYRLWTDDDNFHFISEHYPWFVDTYKGYDRRIKRVDAVRYFILYHYGGVYMDLDFACLRPMGPLIQTSLPTFGVHSTRFHSNMLKNASFAFSGMVANAWMAAVPKDAFFGQIIAELSSSAHMNVLNATGPNYLTKQIIDNYDTFNFRVYDTPIIYNQDWNEKNKCKSIDECKQLQPSAYFATFWSATWHNHSD